ncbi:alpha/beta hydrolase fold-1 domain-containing protein [Planoprotostelium fungivorum]|uniref:Alpha/beta hydrolase fold-1 domain-containing protein n=1 Tax=Planoprotostelium fungivorum TaxID=1890364 RepID=A0A2P6MQ12_9EUKA|nr:alpha/beta hydrolase fold-1 domain-containing protein [Planoprotostelium fungivorum]
MESIRCTEDFLDIDGHQPKEGTESRATILWVHGLGEYATRYDALLRRLSNNLSVTIKGFDHPGHGKSSGNRGCGNYNVSYKTLDQLASTLDTAKTNMVFGHSMGGAIALTWALQRKAKNQKPFAVISSAPAIATPNPPSKFLRWIVGLLCKIGLSNFCIGNALDLNGISRDPECIRQYRDDTMVHGRISLSAARDLFNNGDWLLENASSFDAPLLLYHGDKDRLTSHTGSEAFFSSISSKDKTLKILPGYYHEMHNEPLEEREKVIEMLEGWIRERLEGTSSIANID